MINLAPCLIPNKSAFIDESIFALTPPSSRRLSPDSEEKYRSLQGKGRGKDQDQDEEDSTSGSTLGSGESKGNGKGNGKDALSSSSPTPGWAKGNGNGPPEWARNNKRNWT